MTIRILSPFDWSPVKPGDWLQLNGDHERIIKIELNCEAPTRVDLVHHDALGEERITFLGVIQGLDKIEVVADADAHIAFSTEGEVWYFTNDGVATAVTIPEEATFTQLVSRKSRSDQLEHIIQLQQLSMERLINSQEAERAARQLAEEQLAAALEPEPVVNSPVVVPLGDGEQPAPAPSPARSAQGPDGSIAAEPASVPA